MIINFVYNKNIIFKYLSLNKRVINHYVLKYTYYLRTDYLKIYYSVLYTSK